MKQRNDLKLEHTKKKKKKKTHTNKKFRFDLVIFDGEGLSTVDKNSFLGRSFTSEPKYTFTKLFLRLLSMWLSLT